MSEPRTRPHMGLLVLGSVMGLGLGLAASALGVMFFLRPLPWRQEEQRHSEWALETVLVVVTEVPARENLSEEMLAQRNIPARLVTRDMLRPDDVSSVIGRASIVPLQPGDALRARFFAREERPLEPEERPLAKVCQRTLGTRLARVRWEHTLAEIRGRMIRGDTR